MNEYEIDVCHRHTIYDSDEDESSEPLGNNDLSFRPPNVEPPKGGTLVFALGRISSVFVRTYFEIESAPVFSVATNDSRRALKGHHFARGEADTPVSSVFSSSATVLVCLHEDELNADHCNTWCEGILTALRPEQVLVLQCLPLHEHVDPPASASCFLRSLHTSSWRQAPLATFLEAPNIIKGEAAAILTQCEMNELPAALIVLYGSPSQSGLESVNALHPLLSNVLIRDAVRKMSPSKAAPIIKALLRKPNEDFSHLYM
ncbi:hypothetical protein EMCRGX_G034462 [Ephydatia muelleri]|eukprot:Em0023g381a